MRTQHNLTEVIGFILLGIAVLIIFYNERFTISNLFLPESLLTFNMIFLSILIEAIPFVLIGVFIAGIIQVFVTEEHLQRLIPKNKFLAVIASCFIGALFPACECGIVPIVRRLIAKGVPLFAGVGFLLTGPLINPIVVFSTYMAFGEDLKMALLRMGLGLVIAIIIAGVICILFRSNQLKRSKVSVVMQAQMVSKQPIGKRIKSMFEHAIDEFFDMGKFLIMGAILAAFVQTYVSTKSILGFGEGILASTLIMMGLAYLLSLCSEADAFIAASFRHLFPQASLLGFLIYGPMLDLKNTIMMMAVFNIRFVLVLMGVITGVVLGVLLFVHPWI
ncbi:permease [Halalkalibacter alkaliphilus]|uniref:Permease n=1 Tax=Halalkalibacter alkaliphilus TaxID=2917993 RepID=A0A9X1ZXM8_9BACI|nr:permease [Halalkalibacter alkaliphilus]MCL7746583.1 permease [Halalkalibacter alkaliphilus]